MPPSNNSTLIWLASASMLFSKTSLSAEAGLSTTSPAQIRLTKLSLSDCIHTIRGIGYKFEMDI